MKIPFFDWPEIYKEDRDKYLSCIDRTLLSGGFILQEDVSKFEQNLCNYLGVKYAVGVADGTNALLLGLRASGIGPGDEVILPGHAFIAAAQSIHHAGAACKLVDINMHDWLIDASVIETAITKKTKAIMPVHVNGRLCEMDSIRSLAQKYGLKVFEDGAQALGAKFRGNHVGHYSDWGTFSFYPSKTLGGFGDGGALVTNDKNIYERVMEMRNHGANEKKEISETTDVWGTNSRLDNLQAAILNEKFPKYESYIARRREIAQHYNTNFSGFDHLKLPPQPSLDETNYDVFQNYEICTPLRKRLREHLSSKGIGTIVQWGGLGLNKLVNLGLKKRLPATDLFFQQSALLPMNHFLSDSQVDYITQNVVEFFEANDGAF